MSQTLRHTDYTIAWIAILPIEVEAALGALDKRHRGHFESVRGDDYTYIGGEINGHNVVIAKLPAGQNYGVGAAAALVNQVKARFENIWFALLVGVAAGLPNLSAAQIDRQRDIRLGDVLVCVPDKSSTGIIHYDLGRDTDQGFETNGRQAEPPTIVRAAIGDIQLVKQPFRKGNDLAVLLEEFLKAVDDDQFDYPGQDQDEFFERRTHDQLSLPDAIAGREPRDDRERTRVWYGRIGSGSTLMRNARRRDELRDRYELIGLEMEAAGVMNTVPTGVVRGVCDYGDGHKTKVWQPYAAAVAAVYAKAILLGIRPKLLSSNNDGGLSDANSQPFKFGLDLTEAPVIEDDLFIGRTTQLQEMENVLQPEHLGNPERKHHRIVLGGMGGIGKTQLAIAYANRYRQSYNSTFWLNAASEVVLKQSFRRIAQRIFDLDKYQKLEDEEQLRLCVTRWLLDARNPRWLLIFDNYDEPSAYDLEKYCPYGSHGSAIITTRFPDRVKGTQLLLPLLTNIDEALQILMTRSLRENVSHDIFARKLVERVQGLPLALAAAGAYLKKSAWTFEEYLQGYEKHFSGSVHWPSHLSEYRDRTLYTTWDITYIRLRSEHPQAANLLRSFAFFDNQHLQHSLFNISNDQRIDRKVAKMKSKILSLVGVRAKTDFLEQLSQISVDEFERAMHVLTEFCLVEVRAAHKSYSIHSCVHDWTLANLNAGTQIEGYQFALDHIADFIAGLRRDQYGYALYNVMAPHAARLSNVAFDAVIENVSQGHLANMHNIGDFLSAQLQLVEAERMYLRALAGYEKRLGEEHTSTLDTVNNLGVLYRDQGKLVEAERMYLRALARYEKTLGEEHTSTLTTVNNLGVLYRNQGKLVEAERMYLRALAGYKKSLGEEHTLTLNTVNNLGNLYCDQGRLVEAERMYLRALAGYEKSLGEEYTSTLTTVNNLGVLYRDQGKLVEAERMYLRALAGYEKVLGEEHTLTLDTVNNLGNLYRDQGRLVEAERMYLRALAGSEKSLREEHTLTLTTVNNLGVLYCDQGKLVEAERMYLRALAGREKSLGEEHTSTLTTVNNLGNLYYNQGKLVEAERMYLRALAGSEKSLGEEHTLTLTTVNNLGVLYRNQGKLVEAERMYLRALAGYEKTLGEEYKSTLNTVKNLGVLYYNQGKLAEAERMYVRALAGFKKVLGEEHTLTLDVVHNLGRLYDEDDLPPGWECRFTS